MDYAAQKRLYNIVNSSNYVSFPDSKLQVGATVVNPNNGKVVAMIGGRNLGDVQFGLNRAVQTGRSNGSTMKPLLDYAPAIENLNWSTYHQLEDTEYTYAGTNIQLKDWDEQYEGQMSMRKALVNSRNIPAIRTLEAVGLSNAKKFVKRLGITITEDGLSVGIGGNVSSLQGASAYAAFANGGTYYKPYYVSKIETADGITHTYSKTGKTAMKDSTAYMITDMLKGVPTSYATYANISGLNQAGKTGTTNYSSESIAQNSALSGTAKDSWYNGYTKNYSISVWTGYDSPNQNGISSTYQSVAGKIYKAEMSYLAENTNSNPKWKKPSSVVMRRIVSNGSETPEVLKPGSSQSYTKELFVKGHAPSSSYKESDYTSSSSTHSSSNEVTSNNHSSSSSESTDSENDNTEQNSTDSDNNTNSDNTTTDQTNTDTNSTDQNNTNNNNNTNDTNTNNNNNSNGGTTDSNTGGTTGNTNDNNSNSGGTDSNTGGTTNSGSTTNSGATTNGSSTSSGSVTQAQQ
jgi:penicillin-binding protein 1A